MLVRRHTCELHWGAGDGVRDQIRSLNPKILGGQRVAEVRLAQLPLHLLGVRLALHQVPDPEVGGGMHFAW